MVFSLPGKSTRNFFDLQFIFTGDLSPSHKNGRYPRRQQRLLLSTHLAALIFFGVAAKGTALRGPAEADEPSGAVEVFPVGALTCELDFGSSKHVCWNYTRVISQLVHC